MAGGYPDAPDGRLAYDLDGTQLFRIDHSDGSFETNFTGSTSMEDFNNEHFDSWVFETSVLDAATLKWLFPGPRDLFGVWAGGDAADAGKTFFIDQEVSADARSWSDGTYSATGVSDWSIINQHWDTWLNDIKGFNATNQWAFRGIVPGPGALEFSGRFISQIHLYGTLHDAYYPDRIILIDKATGLEVGVHEWGYNPRGSTGEKVFQVKNNSGSVRAKNVTITFNSLNDHSPDGWHEVKEGAGSYSTSLVISEINANTVHPQDLTIKVVAPSSAGMGPWTNRIVIDSDWELENEINSALTGSAYITAELFVNSTAGLDASSTGVGQISDASLTST